MGDGDPQDAWTLDEALLFAQSVHIGQVRDDGITPVIVHPVGTLRNLVNIAGMKDREMAAAALLHDVLEDCREGEEADTYAGLLDEFGEVVTKMVFDMSVPRWFKDRENKHRLFLDLMRSGDIRTVIVKLCDRLDNIGDMQGWKPQRIERYIKESRELFRTAWVRLASGGVSDCAYLDPINRLYDAFTNILEDRYPEMFLDMLEDADRARS